MGFKKGEGNMEKVAIIGMGTSGMAVAAAYAKEVPSGTVEIDCYDSEDSFGRGLPYREDSEHLILNLKTRMLSYDYENTDDFYDWFNENKIDVPEYASRCKFGLYTRDRLEETLKSINANKITKKVIRLDWLEDEKKWELETENNEIILYDRVHLCAGELPQADPYNLEGNEKYIGKVYPVNTQLKNIDKDDIVTIIGVGLTGVDVASYLLEEKKTNKLYMFSRTNVIPTVRVDPVKLSINHMTFDKVSKIIEEGKGLISFKKFDDLFTRELESHGIDYESFLNKHMSGGIEGLKTNIEEPEDLAIVQALLPPMNLVFNKVWVSLPNNDRKLFRQKYHPFMCLNRSPLPMISAKLLIKASDDGRLTILNNVDNIDIENGSFQILGKSDDFSDHSENVVLTKSDWVCNATGLNIRFDTLDRENTLIGTLLDKRYLQIDDYGGVTVLPEDMSAVSPRFGSLPTLHVHGVLASGVQYRNNSTLIIQKTAHDLMKKLY